jgi:vancomycin aglycone glucosyltransferase
MCVLFSMYGSRGAVEPMAGLAVQWHALGTQVRMCATPECAVSEGCGAPVVIGVLSTGGWR